MEMNKEEKDFDAVKMMREARDKISVETQNMNFNELKEFIKLRLAESKSQLIGKQGNRKR